MHIGIDYRPVSVAPFSGIGRQTKGLERAMKALDNTQVSLFAAVPQQHPLRATTVCPEWGTALAGLQQPHKRWRFEADFLPGALVENAVDVYVATANMGLPISRKSKNTRLVLLLHDLFQLTEHNHHKSRLKALIYRVVDRLSVAWSVYVADQIWCPSEFTASEVKGTFPKAEHKIRVLPNLVSGFLSEPEAVNQLPDDYWLVVGTREPRKNIRFFVEVWFTLKAKMNIPDLVLVGPSKDFPEYVNTVGIHWLSELTEGQLHTVYRNAQCLWQPSYAEGFGLPIVEALSVGTPVATALGSSLDEVTPPDSPRFAANSASALEKCMREVTQQPLQKNKEAYKAWASRYTNGAYQANVHRLISELFHPC